MRILLIEDDEALRAVLVPVLEKAGFGCDTAADGASGLALLLQNPYDAAVVDRMLPALSGLDLVRAARAKGCTVPVLMLTALGRVEDRVEGLGAGADDYLVKPFDNRELIARLQALGRRPAHTLESALLRFDDVSLDAAALTLTGPSGTVRLSKNENALLEALLRRVGRGGLCGRGQSGQLHPLCASPPAHCGQPDCHPHRAGHGLLSGSGR